MISEQEYWLKCQTKWHFDYFCFTKVEEKNGLQYRGKANEGQCNSGFYLNGT